MSLGMFDSGVGGLSALKRLVELAADAGCVYLADTARVPYGVRTRAEVAGFVREIVAKLSCEGCTAIAAACGTATSATPRDILEASAPVFIGAISPAAQAACTASDNGKIAVISTSVTAKSGAFAAKIAEFRPEAEVFSFACDELVPLIERGVFSGPEIAKAVQSCALPIAESGADTLILGCTHFPHAADAIHRAIPVPHLIDIGRELAVKAAPFAEKGRVRYLVSGDAAAFSYTASLIMGCDVSEDVTHFDW